jgi:hypothetical protein
MCHINRAVRIKFPKAVTVASTLRLPCIRHNKVNSLNFITKTNFYLKLNAINPLQFNCEYESKYQPILKPQYFGYNNVKTIS